jgi:hypothetical protein
MARPSRLDAQTYRSAPTVTSRAERARPARRRTSTAQRLDRADEGPPLASRPSARRRARRVGRHRARQHAFGPSPVVGASGGSGQLSQRRPGRDLGRKPGLQVRASFRHRACRRLGRVQTVSCFDRRSSGSTETSRSSLPWVPEVRWPGSTTTPSLFCGCGEGASCQTASHA